jgi:hypothetical protein
VYLEGLTIAVKVGMFHIGPTAPHPIAIALGLPAESTETKSRPGSSNTLETALKSSYGSTFFLRMPLSNEESL